MSPVVHHLNCGTMCPISARLMNGRGGWFSRGRMVCHCLLVETDEGLVLVDTGIGTHDIEHPSGLGWMLNISGKPVYDMAETALAQVRALGFDPPDDVRHIVVTHLDLDHAGGLPDFPNATVHVYQAELDQALSMQGRNSKMRYLPRQWAHGVSWSPYAESGGRWFGFDAVRDLEGVTDDILLIPLVGHSRGHCGVAVRTGDPSEGSEWLLHCGDAYFHRNQMSPGGRDVPAGIKFFQNTMVYDKSARDRNIERLRELNLERSDEVSLICAHDPVTFDTVHGTASS